MKTLREHIKEAEEKNVAIGHFNIATIDMLWGIFEAARNQNVPVLIGTSEGERSYIGPHQAVSLVRSLREEFNFPVYLNADHTYSVDKCKEAIDAGYDAVIFDGAKLDFEENVAKTKEVVSYARKSENDVLIEGELGYIGGSSKLRDEIPEGAEVDGKKLVHPDVAQRYVEETGVDLFAPAVGNLHGMLKGVDNPDIHEDLIADIRAAAGVPLVLHGGSGVTDDDFRDAIKAGISVVHVSTEIRVAYRQAIEQSFEENPDEIAPYRYLNPAKQAVTDVVEEKILLFNSAS